MNNINNKNNKDNKNGKKLPPPPPPVKQPFIIFLILSLVATVALNFFISSVSSPDKTEVSYNEFLKMVEKDKVDEVIISGERITFYGKPEITADELMKEKPPMLFFGGKISEEAAQAQEDASRPVYYTGFINDLRLLDKLDEHKVEYSTPVHYSNPIVNFLLTWILPLVFMYLIIILIMRIMTKKIGGSGGIM